MIHKKLQDWVNTYLFRFYRGQKVLKDVNEFFIYLMDRLVRLHDGIHNLKLIGINLRYSSSKFHRYKSQVYFH